MRELTRGDPLLAEAFQRIVTEVQVAVEHFEGDLLLEA